MPPRKSQAPQATLTFLGAAREVTGSCHLLEVNGQRILLDCGMHQGGDAVERIGTEHFDFDPSAIDRVILSHAHLDHSGLLPSLVHAGFKGPIHCTPGTKSLLKVLLEDAAKLYLNDLEYSNLRLARAGKPPQAALYTETDVAQVLKRCKTLRYGKVADLGDGIELRLLDAGHILGSSIVELCLDIEGRQRRLVFSGDLGNADTALMHRPATLKHADLVVMEGTYGDRNHRSLKATLKEFEDVIAQAGATGGNVLIPSFAVGRTQELLFQLGRMYHEGKLRNWTVFLDSPMASAVTKLYASFSDRLNPDDLALMHRNGGSHSLLDFLPNLIVTDTVDQSMAINRMSRGAIIIAGSGMCTGGRIRHHFKHRLWHENTHVVFIGYQARGTLGRVLVDGKKVIKLFGQSIAVKAQIHTLGGFSAHAGQRQLLDWLGAFESGPRVCLVHGEIEALNALQQAIAEKLETTAEIPERGLRISL